MIKNKGLFIFFSISFTTIFVGTLLTYSFGKTDIFKVTKPTDGIIGEDNRQKQTAQSSPWNAIVRYHSKDSAGKPRACSAVLVSATELLTAAHCVDDGVQPHTIQFIDGSHHKFKNARVEGLRFLGEDLGDSEEQTEQLFDIAILDLKANVKVDPIPILDLDNQDIWPHNRKKAIVAAGYSGDYRGRLAIDPTCQVLLVFEGFWGTDCDLLEGASGGALLIKKDTRYFLAAIMIGIIPNNTHIDENEVTTTIVNGATVGLPAARWKHLVKTSPY